MAVPPRGRAGRRAVGLSPKSRGVGRRTTHILVLEPFGVPAVRSGAALAGFTLARRVRIAPERSAFYRPQASALVGGRVSGSGTRPGSSFRPSPVGGVRPSPDPLPAFRRPRRNGERSVPIEIAEFFPN